MGSGSPLAARLSPSAYTSILIGLLLIGAAFVVFLIIKFLNNRHKTPEYIEAQKSRPSKPADIKQLAQNIKLNKNEINILWQICRNTKAPNILYNYSNESWLDEYFKAEYENLCRQNAPVQEIYSLFKLRFHLYRINTYSKNLTRTNKIPEGTPMIFIARSGTKYNMQLVKNDSHGLLLSCPPELFGNEKDIPAELERIPFIFSMENEIQYSIITRVVQFVTNSQNLKNLLVTHCETVSPQLRRQSRRFNVDIPVKYNAVTAEKNPAGQTVFTFKDNIYQDKITDLSEGGCCMKLQIPIKPQQYIHLVFECSGKTVDTVGFIVATKHDPSTGLYPIHISFKKISLSDKINILGEIYGYNKG